MRGQFSDFDIFNLLYTVRFTTAARVMFKTFVCTPQPEGYSMGAAYISAIVAIPLSLVAVVLAAAHFSKNRHGDKSME